MVSARALEEDAASEQLLNAAGTRCGQGHCAPTSWTCQAGCSSPLFLLLEDQGIVVRFDPETGERLNTDDFSADGGVGTMAVGADSLYVTFGGTFVYDAHEVDIETGEVLQTITSDAAISNIAV